MDIIGYGVVLTIEDGEINSVKLKRMNQQISGARKITTERFTSPGVDASPLVGDMSLIVPVQRSGGGASAAYLDTRNEPKAEPGEYRTYARNADGEVVSEVWQRANGNIDFILTENIGATFAKDGAFTFRNENATVTVAADGAMTLENGNATFEIPTSGNIKSSVAIEAPNFISDDITLTGHKHGGVQTGGNDTQGPKA